jgi:hypothetical protein
MGQPDFSDALDALITLGANNLSDIIPSACYCAKV